MAIYQYIVFDIIALFSLLIAHNGVKSLKGGGGTWVCQVPSPAGIALYPSVDVLFLSFLIYILRAYNKLMLLLLTTGIFI